MGDKKTLDIFNGSMIVLEKWNFFYKINFEV